MDIHEEEALNGQARELTKQAIRIWVQLGYSDEEIEALIPELYDEDQAAIEVLLRAKK